MIYAYQIIVRAVRALRSLRSEVLATGLFWGTSTVLHIIYVVSRTPEAPNRARFRSEPWGPKPRHPETKDQRGVEEPTPVQQGCSGPAREFRLTGMDSSGPVSGL